MRTPPRSLIHFRWLAVGLLGLALQACRTFSGGHASVETPFVVSFDFQEPVKATPEESARFVRALEYAMPERSKVLVDGRQIWPPAGTLKTDRVVTSGAGRGGEEAVVKTRGIGQLANTRDARAFTHETRVTAVANTRKMMGFLHITQVTSMDKAFVFRPQSTQYVAFKSEKDMRDFLRVLGGGKK